MRRRSGIEEEPISVLCPEQAPVLSPGAARVLLRIVRQAAALDDSSQDSAPEAVVVGDELEAA